MAMLLLLSKHSSIQWASWDIVRALSTHVVSAEVAQHVAQYGRGLVKMPSDMVQTLDGYFKDAGLTGKTAKLRTRALTDQLKVLARSQAKGGLQPYRTPGTAALPTPAAAAAAGGPGMTPEQLREQQEMEAEMELYAATFGPEALQELRRRREAAAAAAALPLPTTKGGRLKTSAKAALLDHIHTHGLLSLPHEHVRAAFDLPPSSTLQSVDRNLDLKKVTPAYNEPQALAYALSRLPACFAASCRIFKELRVRLPGFKPKTMLDFGAGPGTAGWAAQEAWPDGLSRLTAVEPSAAMRRLGERLEAARRFAHINAPMVRWRPELPPVPRSQRKQAGAQRYDLVVASYVLGEVADPQERASLVRQLWDLTSEMLVLIEPGTPWGSAIIQEARAAILTHELRRTDKLRKRLDQASSQTPTSNTSSNSSQLLDPNLVQKLNSRRFGAYVVAPCPHDGPCPLAAPGSKAWCHFGTRFQRPGFMQAAKALKGSRVNPQDHQDERYSYVVIRRGSRPAVLSDVDISRNFIAQLRTAGSSGSSSGSSSSSSSGSSGSVPADVQATANAWEQRCDADDDADAADGDSDTNSDMEDGVSASSYSSSSSSSSMFDAADERAELLQFSEEQIQQQVQAIRQEREQHSAARTAAAAAATTAAAAVGGGATELFTSSELQQLSALLGLDHQQPTALKGHQQQHEQQHTTRATDSAADGIPAAHYHSVNARLDAFGEGLINRLIALENAGVDWAAGGAAGLSPQLAADAAAHAAAAAAPVTAEPSSDLYTGISSSSSNSRDADKMPTSVDSMTASSGSSSSSTAKQSMDETAAERQLAIRQLMQMHQQQQEEDWQQQQQQDPQERQQLELSAYELETAAAASGVWSRIIRPPRKRGGHVILDVCAATGSSSSSSSSGDGCSSSSEALLGGDCRSGQLERHIIARSDAKKWMGRAAYALSQSAQWGDLWPSFYHRNPKRQVLK